MRSTNLLVFLGCCVFMIAWEIYLLSKKKETISVSLYETAKKYPILPFAVGILMGHFFWSVYSTGGN